MTDIKLKEKYTLDDLMEILTVLRGENGCPWDRAQTHETIKKCMIEEVYEAIDALDSGDDAMFANELGDLLLQVAFHAKIASERGAFDIDKVLYEVCTKLITRHTHVFGDDTASDAASALGTWEKNKKKEKNLDTAYDVLNDVPHHLPALMRAEKVQKKAQSLGVEEYSEEKALRSCETYLNEIKEHNSPAENYRKLLFSVTALGRALGLTPETELAAETNSFIVSKAK